MECLDAALTACTAQEIHQLLTWYGSPLEAALQANVCQKLDLESQNCGKAFVYVKSHHITRKGLKAVCIGHDDRLFEPCQFRAINLPDNSDGSASTKYCRLATSKILSSLRGGSPSVLSFVQYSSASPQVVYKKFETPKDEEHDYKNMRLKRPMSPHLTIYAFQLTSITSITHRFTGMMLAGYAVALGCGALVLPNDVSHYVTMVEGLQLSSASLFTLKLFLAAPFGYHLSNGIRHLFWDTGKALTIKEVYTTGYIMLGFGALITAALAAL